MGMTGAVDLAVVSISNLVNVLMTAIFLVRVRGTLQTERTIGVALEMLGLPLALAVVFNFSAGRGWWWVFLPSMLTAFLVIELVLDYVLKSDFRATRLLGPYLGLYYLALMGMVGYSFMVGRTFGFVTLSTYFLQLIASWYSYSKVRHGTMTRP